MQTLDDDNDPMLFAVTVPNGKLIVQYMEVLTAVQASLPSGTTEPTPQMILAAIRSTARTLDVAKEATDPVLMAAWLRMTNKVQASGNE